MENIIENNEVKNAAESGEVKETTAKAAVQRQPVSKTRTMVQIAMLGAVAAVLMFLEFPAPFLAPPFYKIDFSELPVLIGGFAMGPVAGVVIEAIKIALHLLFKGTQTAFVGELGNFIMGCALVVPAALIYKFHKTRRMALVSLIIGVIVTSVVSVFVNAYMLLPAYGAAFNLPMEVIVGMGQAIHPSINTVMGFCLLTVLPFNLFKGVLSLVVTMLVYKHIRKILK